MTLKYVEYKKAEKPRHYTFQLKVITENAWNNAMQL